MDERVKELAEEMETADANREREYWEHDSTEVPFLYEYIAKHLIEKGWRKV